MVRRGLEERRRC